MTLDEQIVAGIEQILNDYMNDFSIQKKLETGETFPLFQRGISGYVLHQDGIHRISKYHSGLISVQQAAFEYYCGYFQGIRDQTISNVPLSVTGVKYQLLNKLEERANEFRKFDCRKSGLISGRKEKMQKQRIIEGIEKVFEGYAKDEESIEALRTSNSLVLELFRFLQIFAPFFVQPCDFVHQFSGLASLLLALLDYFGAFTE